ncbi:MAG: thioesterase family protein [Clostridiales bacterium]|nr:thioesterase family protein [Clostridiales bacterium]
MDFDIRPGMEKTVETTVTDDRLASALGSGMAKVFATPGMIALMENAAMQAIHNALPEGFSSVGTRVEADHIAATPPGMRVRAVARVIAVDGRKVEFEVEAFDEVEKIGQAAHTRFIVEASRFEDKAMRKASQKAK